MTRIAVVDDDQVLLDLMKEIMAEQGWDVLSYLHADTAFEDLKRDMPDVILLDIRLSETTSGWDILHQLKADPATRTIPVIIWSGDLSRLQDKQAWLEEHQIATLPKPFDIEVLFQTVERTLSQNTETVYEAITA